jgi:hypothetical protein
LYAHDGPDIVVAGVIRSQATDRFAQAFKVEPCLFGKILLQAFPLKYWLEYTVSQRIRGLK